MDDRLHNVREVSGDFVDILGENGKVPQWGSAQIDDRMPDLIVNRFVFTRRLL